ncbi:hypothetical protein IEQ34_018864 [Dendrobium chrysotoxum]|uniref:Transmembrane protein n=1 Tax=Dendrobium chrysotoxum TaxID=161865 RepID=A0AAV7G6X9_DENCH|nr:hypothetical protein IEQ34_018864 [Dendrobium chrysotoxum]
MKKKISTHKAPMKTMMMMDSVGLTVGLYGAPLLVASLGFYFCYVCSGKKIILCGCRMLSRGQSECAKSPLCSVPRLGIFRYRGSRTADMTAPDSPERHRTGSNLRIE